MKLEGLFKYGSPTGELKSYYSNGHPQSDLIFEEVDLSRKEDPVIGIINAWDSLGNQMVTSGNGFCTCRLAPFLIKNEIETGKVENGVKVGKWKGRISEAADFVESYNDGVLVRGVQHFEGQDFEYTRIDVRAAPIGGSKSFYEFIGRKMKYPTRARRKGIEGKVFIEFVVDKEGNLTNGRVVKGIDEECDQEALNAVMASPKWSPGYRRGRAAKQRYTLPLIFKLH
jgi:TonB family protein